MRRFILARFKTGASAISLLLLCMFAQPVYAQGWMSSDGAMSLSIGAGNYLLSREVLRSSGAASRSRPIAPVARKTTSAAQPVARRTTAFSNTPSVHPGIDAFMPNFPAIQREQVRADMVRMLGAYDQVALQLGAKRHDVGSAVAAYLAGTYAGYHNQLFPNDAFAPLARRMSTELSSNAGFSALSDLKKQAVYEQLVVIGMTLTIAQLEVQKNPRSPLRTQMRTLSQKTLSSTFGLDASNLYIGPEELRLR